MKNKNNDKNSTKINEIYDCFPHKMFVEGEELSKAFEDTFKATANEYYSLEKVDLMDYWKTENGRTNKTR